MFSDGFTDLRMNHQSGQGDDSFWPSFTDVMTVIVMIFLLAMVVVMIRNSELIQQLRTTMEAERATAALARATSEEKEGLALRLVDAEQKLSMLRMEMMRVTEQRDKARTALARQSESLAELKADFQSSQSSLLASQTRQQQTQQRLDQTIEQRDALSSQLATAARQLAQARAALANLQQDYREQSRELQIAVSASKQAKDRLAVLGGEYDELKIKYDKLVRPARTPRGKFVTEVRINKLDGKIRFSVKNLTDKNFITVSESELHQRLSALKKKHPKTLYVKIIIPDDNQLSYTEAWNYTNEIHKKYDYYFQKE